MSNPDVKKLRSSVVKIRTMKKKSSGDPDFFSVTAKNSKKIVPEISKNPIMYPDLHTQPYLEHVANNLNFNCGNKVRECWHNTFCLNLTKTDMFSIWLEPTSLLLIISYCIYFNERIIPEQSSMHSCLNAFLKSSNYITTSVLLAYLCLYVMFCNFNILWNIV